MTANSVSIINISTSTSIYDDDDDDCPSGVCAITHKSMDKYGVNITLSLGQNKCDNFKAKK